jgi:hypothetical protein
MLSLKKADALDANRSPSRPRVVRGILATSFAFVAFAVGPLQVAAECDGPVPSFSGAVATAKRVVIGDVVAVREGGLVKPAASAGSSSRFTLRVRYAVVGDAEKSMEIRDLLTQPCAGVVQAREGDRIALAFNATDIHRDGTVIQFEMRAARNRRAARSCLGRAAITGTPIDRAALARVRPCSWWKTAHACWSSSDSNPRPRRRKAA